MKRFTTIWMCFILVFSSAFVLSDISENVGAANDPIQPPPGGTVEVWGDWEVTDARAYQDCTIILNGNLIIQDSGWLDLFNVTLIMNNTVPEQYIIEVYGDMTISDWDNNRFTQNDSSLITSPSKDNFYRIWVDDNFIGYGTFRAFNSIIENSGGELEIGGHIYHRSAFGINEDCNIHLEGNIVRNCSFLMSTYRVTGGKIINNTFSDFIGPINVDVCDDWIISGNRFVDSSRDFYNFDIIYIEHGSGHIISNNFISSSFYGSGLHLWNAINCIVKGNDICANGESGIIIVGGMTYDCAYNTITGNNITNNKNGISFYSYNAGTTHNNTIQNNSILGNLAYAFVVDGEINVNNDARFNLFGTDNQTLIDELVFGDINYSNHLSHRDGNFQYINSTDTWSGNISLDGGVIVNSNLTIDSADVVFNETYGPQFIQVNGELWITNSSFSSLCSNYSIVYLSPAKGNVVSTSITGQMGISLNNDGFVMNDSTFDSGFYGIYSHNGSDQYYSGINISNGRIGIEMYNISNVEFQELYVDNHADESIIVEDCENVSYNNCTVISNPTYTAQTMDAFYLYNSSFTNMNFLSAYGPGSIRFVYGSNNLYQNITMNRTIDNPDRGTALFMGIQSNSTLAGCTISNNYVGLALGGAYYCDIINNKITGCDTGMRISDSFGNTGAYTLIGSNQIDNNGVGIYFKQYCYNYEVTGCTFINNDVGFEIGFSSNNDIYHNNFIANANHLQASTDLNSWDNGYPSGGNYWDNYGGNDFFSGPNQNIPGSDGIGDTALVINANNRDYYPLMNPFPIVHKNIPLLEGWNLISIPLTQLKYSLDSVLNNINGKWDYAQTYNGLTGVWESNSPYRPESTNDFQSMSLQVGFWINITESDVVLTVVGEEVGSTNIPLYAGWNLVGYPSLNTEIVADALWGTGADKVEVFDPAEPYRIKEVSPTYIMRPGEGYWIHVPADTVWIVDW